MGFNIPVIINNFNRLTTTRKLAEDLSKLGYRNIHILDNASTYPPLLEWYKECPYTVKRLDANLGNLAIYNSAYISNFNGWVVYSDSDILLGENTPQDVVEKMIEATEKYGYLKAGLSLRIDDLPNTDYGNKARIWERKYWEQKLEEDVYEAEVDTTFSIIRTDQPFMYKALRLGGRYTAIHHPWYLDYSNLSEEEKYVINASDSTYSTTKRYVNSLSL